MSFLLVATILVSAPTAQVEKVDVAYEELAKAQDAAAIELLAGQAAEARTHPAALINLGVAHARRGDDATARRLFERAAMMAERYELETATGSWVDSRELARKALASLDRGGFSSSMRTASR